MTTSTATFDQLSRRFQADFQARLPQHIGRLQWDGRQVATHQRDRLRLLLAHAMQHSPFHSRRLAGIDPQRFELEDLASLPVMTKAEMMANFDDVLTDRRLNRSAVDAYIASAGPLPELLLDDYACLTSGGSSGVRGLFVYGWDAFLDVTLAVLRPSIARMLASAGSVPPGLVLGLVAAPTAIHMTRAASVLADGGMTTIVSAPATLPVQEIVKRLNQGNPQVLIGYAGAIRMLAAEQAAGRLAIRPIAIGTTSEQLTPEAASAISAAFGVPVANMFGSSEGLIGSSEPGADTITFASDLAIAEPVDEDYRPVPPGRPSARVLVTSLCNFAQPLIRFEMEDSFVQQPGRPANGHFCATVQGRSDEALVYGGRAFHPLVIRALLNRNASVFEYQVRQTPDGVDVSVVTSGPLDEAELSEQLAGALEGAGLSGARVSMRSVNQLERQPQTGKVRRFVPLT